MFGIRWTGSSQYLSLSISLLRRGEGGGAYADAHVNGRLKGNVFVHKVFERKSLALRGRGGNGESAPRVEVGDVSSMQLAMDSQEAKSTYTSRRFAGSGSGELASSVFVGA